MSRLRRFAIALLVLGGVMTTGSSIANRIGAMDDFWAGFVFGIAVGIILWGVALLVKDQIALRKEKK